MSLGAIAAICVACSTLGAAGVGTLTFLGGGIVAPDARLAKVEQYDVVRKKTVDSLFRVNKNRLDSLSDRLDFIGDLQLRQVAMSCLDDAEARRLLLAQMPCGYVISELKLKP